jgi:hypothetical protein
LLCGLNRISCVCSNQAQPWHTSFPEAARMGVKSRMKSIDFYKKLPTQVYAAAICHRSACAAVPGECAVWCHTVSLPLRSMIRQSP